MATYEDSVAEIMERPWLYPGLLQRSAEDLLLSFSHNHSLRVWSTWHVFLSNMRFYVRRIEWARGMDRVELSGLTPSTFGAESIFSKPKAEALIDSARNLVQLTEQKPLSGYMIDGVYCSVSLWQHAQRATTSWISGHPTAQGFDEWLTQATAVANDSLPQSSAHLSYGNL